MGAGHVISWYPPSGLQALKPWSTTTIEEITYNHVIQRHRDDHVAPWRNHLCHSSQWQCCAPSSAPILSAFYSSSTYHPCIDPMLHRLLLLPSLRILIFVLHLVTPDHPNQSTPQFKRMASFKRTGNAQIGRNNDRRKSIATCSQIAPPNTQKLACMLTKCGKVKV